MTAAVQLRIRNISKTYPNRVRALDDVSLTIPTGMFAAEARRAGIDPCHLLIDWEMDDNIEVVELYTSQAVTVGPARFELTTSCSGGKRSIQLSYGPNLLSIVD